MAVAGLAGRTLAGPLEIDPMATLEWIGAAFGMLVVGGGGYLFWRGLSLRPHGPDHPRPPTRWVSG